ncbi:MULTISPECIES: cupin domain-containing protein [Christiangramia]|nr:cupin domain-containing protein [Christiangramia flava]
MKLLIRLILFTLPTMVIAQSSEYSISSYKEEGTKAPNVHYIGEAWLHPILHDDDDFNYNITKAKFKANSTLDWHKHSSVQILIIVEGEAYYQERDKSPVILRTGDIIRCDKNIEHWHSSTKNSNVTYLAIYSGKEPTEWTAVLTQDEYDKVAKTLSTN